MPAMHMTSTVSATIVKLRPSIPTKYSACKIPHEPKSRENQVTFSVNRKEENESPFVSETTKINRVTWIAEIARVKNLNVFFETLGMNRESNAAATGVKIKVVRRYCDIRVYINTKNRKIINPNTAQKI